MVKNIYKLLHISRPRFWLYTAGTYAVGVIAGVSTWQDLNSFSVLSYFVYFLIPANIFIYGINDLYDADTDALNPKKDEKEHRLASAEHVWLKRILIVVSLLSAVLLMLAGNVVASAWFGLFLFLSWGYSASPFRFKAKPFFDFASNLLYAIPGFTAYAQLTGNLPPLWVLIVAMCWTGAMHLFSAVPDIEVDKLAGIRTTAVALGKQNSLILCAGLWLTAILSAYFGHFSIIVIVLGLVYFVVPCVLVLRPNISVTKAYWYFPYLNSIFGLLLFWSIALTKPYA